MKLCSAAKSASSSEMTHKEEIQIWIIRYYIKPDSWKRAQAVHLILLMLISECGSIL